MTQTQCIRLNRKPAFYFKSPLTESFQLLTKHKDGWILGTHYSETVLQSWVNNGLFLPLAGWHELAWHESYLNTLGEQAKLSSRVYEKDLSSFVPTAFTPCLCRLILIAFFAIAKKIFFATGRAGLCA